MVPSSLLMNLPDHLLRVIKSIVTKLALLSCGVFFLLSGPAIGGTPIQQDPKGFFNMTWGSPLANRNDLKEIDDSNVLKIYTLKQGNPHVEGIPMESVKLYGLEDQYARALFHYKGASTHQSLIRYLEDRFGKIGPSHGGMMRGLNQQYTWRGPDTEITITYHGFRERGFLTAESRVLAPRFLDVHSDHSF